MAAISSPNGKNTFLFPSSIRSHASPTWPPRDKAMQIKPVEANLSFYALTWKALVPLKGRYTRAISYNVINV